MDAELADGIREEDVDRWVQSACVLCSNGCGLDIAVSGWSDGRRPRARARPGQPRQARAEGPPGLAGTAARPAGAAPGPARWSAGRGRLGRGDGPRRGPVPRASRHDRAAVPRLLHQRPAHAGGVLHPRGHREGRRSARRTWTGTPGCARRRRRPRSRRPSAPTGSPAATPTSTCCDAVFHYGHNVAETQTVLWARMLDRLAGTNPPVHVTVDPRPTKVAQARGAPRRPAGDQPGGHERPAPRAGPPRLGRPRLRRRRTRAVSTTLAQDRRALHARARRGDLPGVRRRDVERAAEVFGTSERVVSTVLQGFYQSHQATAASVQVNNMHLLRGMLGRPGAGILQMNGQPTAQNNRETGVDGDLSGFRNWENEAARPGARRPVGRRPRSSSRTGRRRRTRCRSSGTPSRARSACCGSPAPTRPSRCRSSGRIREILAGDQVFVVVNDAYLTETAELADVVLPCGAVGREDRNVHQRRPHRAPRGAGRRPARGGPQRPRHLGRLCPPDGFHRPQRPADPAVGHPRGGLRRPGGSAREAGRATTRA